ncbi:type II toxin-antitoxin system RelE/ParE family toxin [candidate division KSB1 bacterium]|nr:type II toxin-antitoxin system RelE/ParE family toxin [candidate division KSB1 bacterium]NIR69489.1 type II toxin-antitoxin system RelE/ParE family toxin [candidate division KSB1 bacterium]NIS22839.1 type II toxin-antitoxin system RelE/ParE family toxin [candidate division KSB1 bacterium]NIT69678.1 type II toxin-antitoxin system RelE/ParE family toxin [candidate division KSB1 bacterium]NIU23348.1 type II toxin-antitoxin system RelE/ParE family toxin [candidate division KSB1 bacterium]
MSDYIFHPEAAEEYANAYEWYAKRSLRIADEFEREIERALRLITNTPETWPKYDDQHRYFLIRKFPFSIIYRIFNERIYVIAVAHGSRRPNYWKNRE